MPTQAIDLLTQMPFDIVFADVATPELDGLKMCRAIKRSRRLSRSRVVVTTSVVDSGQIPDDLLQRASADGYLEKPLDTRRLHRLLRDLSGEERADHEGLLADALGRYHVGDIEGARYVADRLREFRNPVGDSWFESCKDPVAARSMPQCQPADRVIDWRTLR